jgi:putative MATE family efflux protein
MSVNIIIDGIFVGHGVGPVALASVNVATPMYSVFLSLGLLIGVGGGAVYSIALGSGETDKARRIFTMSMVLITAITIVVAGLSYLFMEEIAHFFGANKDTFAYVIDYIWILILFSPFMAWEAVLSVFVRNDGNPTLAMAGLIVTAVVNIVLDYWMIFMLKWEVIGAALATVIAIAIGVLVLCAHFFKKGSLLKFVRPTFAWWEMKVIPAVGFPSFLSEVGLAVFIIGYNIVLAMYAGTNGLAAFSVINYLHFFMFLVFVGIGSAVQPMISYYYGAHQFQHIKDTVKLAEKAALFFGALFFIGGFFGAPYLVALFGVTSEVIVGLAVTGIRLFFIGYLFMGFNFIYMTYFQSIGYVKPAMWITIFRHFIIFIPVLIVLPYFFGIHGAWLVLPVSETLLAAVLFGFARKGVVGKLGGVVEIND